MMIGYGIVMLIYCITISLLYHGIGKLPNIPLNNTNHKNAFSIVVVFRNEAERLPALVHSFTTLLYPRTHFEIIFVNDGSIDGSEAAIRQQLDDSDITFQILQNNYQEGSPKKRGITSAIERATFPWILTTDADCIVPAQWLHDFNAYINKKQPVCVVAPVDYDVSNGILHGYQQLDFWSLQGVTRGSAGLRNVLIGNGANFAYRKSAFQAVQGFDGNAHVASGDDTFLLEKFKQAYPEQLGYLNSKSATVTTFPADTWRRMISQRLRWASKTSQQQAILPKIIGGIVVLASTNVLVTPLLWLIHLDYFWVSMIFIFLKMSIDYLFLARCARFFEKPLRLPLFFISFFMNAFFTFLIFVLSLFTDYQWKQRKFRR